MKETSKQVNKNLTKLVRIDAGYHKMLKLRATNAGRSIKELVEGILSDALAVEDCENVK